MTKLKVGLIDAGNISDTYASGLSLFDTLELAAISSIDAECAKAKKGAEVFADAIK